MGRLTAIVLGSAAGGGYPQWNCRCRVCRLAWDGDRRVKPRTQTSVAITGDGDHWILLNATPDLGAQLHATPELHPRGEGRSSPIAAVVLTGAEIDQTAGLLTMREGQAVTLYATAESLNFVAANPMFDALSRVTPQALQLGQSVALPGGVTATLFAVPGKAPLYAEGERPDVAVESGVNVGVVLERDDARLVFVPGCAAVTPDLKRRLRPRDVLLFDGTLFTDDEMLRAGLSEKTGRRMGHMPIDGAGGSVAALADCPARRIYIHINNSNPMLIDTRLNARQPKPRGGRSLRTGLGSSSNPLVTRA